MVLVILYASFRLGINAYGRLEEKLVDQREGEIFLIQLEQELRSAIPYTQSKDQNENQFVGKKNSIQFPVRLIRYTEKGVEEGIFLVKYEKKGGSLIRVEKKLRKRSLKDKNKELKETLFQKLKTFQLEYLFANRSDELIWDKEWLNNPYVGLPRGVRLTIAGDVFGKKERVVEILIPQGVLIKRYSS
jgi:hypothetical protein